MKQMRHCLLVLLTTVAVTSQMAIADVQVDYTVDEKALKTGAPAGTSLAFQLFSDPACTMPVGSPVSVNVENVTLIERLKRLTPKGGTKGPVTDRLNHVLAGVTAPSTAFLTVTGQGITPVGGACQLQTSAGSIASGNAPVIGSVAEGVSHGYTTCAAADDIVVASVPVTLTERSAIVVFGQVLPRNYTDTGPTRHLAYVDLLSGSTPVAFRIGTRIALNPGDLPHDLEATGPLLDTTLLYKAAPGSYTLRLHLASPGGSACGQVIGTSGDGVLSFHTVPTP
jgi:hypothetical protein